MDNLFEFAAGLTRAHAATLRDDPNRIATPDYVKPAPHFDQLPLEQRRDAADRLCRRDFYREALIEAFGEHELSASFFAMIRDSSTPANVIGQLAIEIGLDYVARCAERNGEDIRDFL